MARSVRSSAGALPAFFLRIRHNRDFCVRRNPRACFRGLNSKSANSNCAKSSIHNKGKAKSEDEAEKSEEQEKPSRKRHLEEEESPSAQMRDKKKQKK